jgi:myo-inositol-1(or 4)-monophosphatase
MDPIDGTVNFRYERDYSGISVAYVENGKVQVGMVLNPFRNEFFHAERGQGAFVGDKKLHVSNQSEITKATVYTDDTYNPAGLRLTLEALLRLPQVPWLLLRGSAVLEFCDIAAGRADLYFHRNLKPWDNAAGFLIVEEAGGVITDHSGKKVNFMSDQVIAGNPKLVEKFAKAIA